jgi:anti-anti-sigma factor
MTRHDVARNAQPPSGDGVARAVTYEQEGQGRGHPDHWEGARRARGRIERPGRGRVRPGSARDGDGPVPIRPRVIRTHRLRIRGELGHDSAVALEIEIDALLESGIEELVLDLGELRTIDATGVRVIAMRCELCRRRGTRVELTGAMGAVAVALAAAGLETVEPRVHGPGGSDAEIRSNPARIAETQ